jgi:cyanophycinase-like exopeptidase
MARRPGVIVLFGSGETSADAQPIHDFVLKRATPPIRASILETPAGFELNSAQVASRLAEFLRVRLQNYRPEVAVVPARKRGTANSPDDPAIVAPLLTSNYLMMGPGSPTYAIRQLANSRAWHLVLARHRLGHPIVLASAATVAASAYAIPVYEIYKVGEDPRWATGLDLLGPFGPSVAFVPHWDNTDGGEELDTSHCFMGKPRFEQLLEMLPSNVVLLGIDEHTALVVDFEEGVCRVMGSGGVRLRRAAEERRFGRRETFDLAEIGVIRWPEPSEGIPADVWESALAADVADVGVPEPSEEVRALVASRAAARANRDWATADRLRGEIAQLGWQVKDSPSGAEIVPLT